MLKGKERQIVLDCLYQESLKEAKKHTVFEVKAKMTAKLEAQLRYEHISSRERIQIYCNFICKKITKYIADDINKSATMYWVNGTPEKRNKRIAEYAHYAFARMPENQKIAICEKLGFKYLSN